MIVDPSASDTGDTMDFDIPDAFRDVVELAGSFARADLREAENELDRMPDAASAFTSETHRSITKKMHALGLHKLTLPEAVGGLGLPPLARFLVERELAVGGAGLTAQMLVTPMGAALIAALGLADRHPVYRDYLEAFVEDTDGIHSSAWSITEPDLGSDIFSLGRPDVRFRATARPQSGGWIIDGAKSAWCTNGWLADMLVLMVHVEGHRDLEGTATFLVPADWPGIRKGQPLEKVGMRALNQCEIAFDHVEVPGEFLIFEPGGTYAQVLDSFVTPGNTSVGGIAHGVARAAYEYGLPYAKERRQQGVPIIEHQLVAKRVFDSYRSIEAAGLLLDKSAALISQGRGRAELAFAARVHACETVAKVTADMMFVHGAFGMTKEFPLEKLHRDSGPLQVMDGTVDRVAMKGAARL